jgi:DNA-binding XRE family transcriptional regulator
MKTFRNHLNESLKNEKFSKLYDEEKELLKLSLMLQEARKNAGISQQEIARQAHLTQQQISRLESGENCNILTYLKAGNAVGLKLSLQPTRSPSRKPALKAQKQPLARLRSKSMH